MQNLNQNLDQIEQSLQKGWISRQQAQTEFLRILEELQINQSQSTLQILNERLKQINELIEGKNDVSAIAKKQIQNIQKAIILKKFLQEQDLIEIQENYQICKLSQCKDKIKEGLLKIVCDILIVDCDLIVPYLNIQIKVKKILIDGDRVIKISGMKKKNSNEVLKQGGSFVLNYQQCENLYQLKLKNYGDFYHGNQEAKFDQNSENYILVSRKKIQKGKFEKVWDFVGTMGNNKFQEEYLFFEKGEQGKIGENGQIVIKIENQDQESTQIQIQQKILKSGNSKIFSRLYQAEYQLSDARQYVDFDLKKSVLKRFQAIQDAHQKINHKRLIQMMDSDQYEKSENNNVREQDDDTKLQLAGKAIMYGGVSVAISRSAVEVQKQVVLQTFKVVNNKLYAQGIKGAMSIGGKYFLQEGAKAVVQQSGKEIAKGVVENVVTNSAGQVVQVTVAQTTQTVAQQSFIGGVKGLFTVASLSTMAIGVAATAALGAIKSVVNSGWISEYKEEKMHQITPELIEEFFIKYYKGNGLEQEIQEQKNNLQNQ